MVKLSNLGRLTRTLRSLVKNHPDVNVIVSYGTDYAIYVHEDLKANHPNGGQAKFLEQPAREMRKDLQDQITQDIKNGIKVPAALFKAGLKLQRASQELVPVDTGQLRASAQTELVKK